VAKVNSALEKAIINRAMEDPRFLADLLADPAGCLKALARDEPRTLVRLGPGGPRPGRRTPH